ncbi:MAG: PDZ domain-containing protein [Actinomycetia bacterium]|nr:PDZ domain-containing protein [Actinomycetes bacterium]
MRSDDDDEADGIGGPPPDPSLRAWRHPSEIASAAAAAGRPVAPSPSTRSPLILPAIAAIVAAGVVATAVVGLGALTASFDSMQDAERLGVEAANGVTTSIGRTIRNSLISPSASSSPSTTATSPTTSTVRDVTPEATTNDNGAHQWSADPDPTLKAGDGVFTKADGSPIKLAAFMVVDETVFTSAAAIGDHRDLGLVVGGNWIMATVVVTDVGNDVAMLQIADDDLSYLLAESRAVWAMPEDYETPKPGTEILVTTLASAQDEPAGGVVLASTGRTVASSGTPVYGSVITSAYRPAGTSGGAMIDQDGGLVGLIVDSDRELAEAVPVDRLLAIKDTFQRWGIPALEWLGVEGGNQSTGGTVLAAVIEGGPADRADLRPGDIITAIDGTMVENWHHLVFLIRQSGTGSTIEVAVERQSRNEIVVATVGSRTDPALALALGGSTAADDD